MAFVAGEVHMYGLDHSSHNSIIERRNFSMGLWAGQLMGYEGDDLALYAGKIMASDLAEPGPQDMIARIVSDFAANGIYVTNREIGSRLGQTEQLVRAELLGTD
jgi:hypothetical protein